MDPSDYGTLLDALKSGKDELDTRKRLAWKAYQHTATYDSTVAEWMWSQIGACDLFLDIRSFLPRFAFLSTDEH